MENLGKCSSEFMFRVQFYTQTKTVTALWRSEDAAIEQAAVTMPTMK
jgi:hypothetical protein